MFSRERFSRYPERCRRGNHAGPEDGDCQTCCLGISLLLLRQSAGVVLRTGAKFEMYGRLGLHTQADYGASGLFRGAFYADGGVD